MKNSKYLIMIVWTLLFSCCILWSCDSSGEDASQINQDKKVSIEIWSFFDYNTPGNHYINLWEGLAEEYGYELNVKVFNTEELQDKLRISLICGELPDVFEVWGGSFPEFLIEAGVCKKVDDYIENSGIDYKEEYISPYKDGHRYIIPCLVDAYAVNYYNLELMEEIGLEVPDTWDELIDMVDQVNAYNASNGTSYVPVGFGNKDSWLGELLYTMIVNRQNPYAFDQLISGDIDFENDVFYEAAEKIILLNEHQAFAKDFMQTGEVESAQNFVDGQTVMLPHQSTIMYYLIENMGEESFMMAQFPDCSDGAYGDHTTYLMNANPHMTPGLCINENTDYADEAARVCLEFSKRVNEINYTEYGYFNYTNDTTLEPPAQLSMPVYQFTSMIENQQHLTGFWYYELSKESADAWRNLTKKLYADVIDANTFIEEGKKYIHQKNMVYY